MNSILSELVERHNQGRAARFSEVDLTCWANGSINQFFDGMGAEIALSYHRGEIPFAVCDQIVNDLYAVLISQKVEKGQSGWPHLFDEVYEAFDAGEWHRLSDKSDDPSAEYTDPAIAIIVARL